MATPNRDIPGLFMNDYARAALSLLVATSGRMRGSSKTSALSPTSDIPGVASDFRC